jgi:hypothetical protein
MFAGRAVGVFPSAPLAYPVKNVDAPQIAVNFKNLRRSMSYVSRGSSLALYAHRTGHHTQALRPISIALAANSQCTIAAGRVAHKKVVCEILFWRYVTTCITMTYLCDSWSTFVFSIER